MTTLARLLLVFIVTLGWFCHSTTGLAISIPVWTFKERTSSTFSVQVYRWFFGYYWTDPLNFLDNDFCMRKDPSDTIWVCKYHIYILGPYVDCTLKNFNCMSGNSSPPPPCSTYLSIQCQSGHTERVTWDSSQSAKVSYFNSSYVTFSKCSQLCSQTTSEPDGDGVTSMLLATGDPINGTIEMIATTTTPKSATTITTTTTPTTGTISAESSPTMTMFMKLNKDDDNKSDKTPIIVGVTVSLLIIVVIIVVVVVFLLYRKRRAGLCKGEAGPVNGHMNNSYTGVDTCRHGNTVNNMGGSNDRKDMKMTNINTNAHYDKNIRSNNDNSKNNNNNNNNSNSSKTTPTYDSPETPTNDNPLIPTLASTPTTSSLAHPDPDTNDTTRPAPLYSRLNEELTRTTTNLYNVGPDNSTHVYSKLGQDQPQQRVLGNTYDVQPSRKDDNATSTRNVNLTPTTDSSKDPTVNSPTGTYSQAGPLNPESSGHLDPDTNDTTRPAPLYSRLNEEPTRTRTNLYNVGPDNSTHVYSKLGQDQPQQRVLDNPYDVQPSGGDDIPTSTSTDNSAPTSDNSKGPSRDSLTANYSLAQPLNLNAIGHLEPETNEGSTAV